MLGVARAAMFKSGRATMFPHEGAAFLRTDPSAASPDVQIHFMASGLNSMKLRLPFAKRPEDGAVYGYTALVCQLRPESRGEIRLRSDDPAAPPIIRANYLATETDRRVMREGYKTVRKIFAQEAFDAVRGPALVPPAEFRNDAEIDAWVASAASTIFHPVGTCRMGVDEGAVVDEQLRVNGVEGLRVVDASVMPRLVSANTHARHGDDRRAGGGFRPRAINRGGRGSPNRAQAAATAVPSICSAGCVVITARLRKARPIGVPSRAEAVVPAVR